MTDESYIDTKPLEIHVERKIFKSQFFWSIIQIIFYFGSGIAIAFSNEKSVIKYLLVVFLVWITIVLIPIIYNGYLGLHTKGPVFSFSKHGLIDHRAESPIPLQRSDIKFVAWISHKDKIGEYHMLRIDLNKKPLTQKFGWMFGYHPFALNSRMITHPENRLATRIKSAVPPGKYRTARNLKKS